MLIQDIFRLSTRMFKANRSRTILTVLGISVGIGTILFLVSLGYGLQRLILSQITTSEALLSLDVSAVDENMALNDDSIAEIKEIPGVEKVSPVISMPAQMEIGDISSELITNFAEPIFFSLEGMATVEGRLFSDSDESKDGIIISSAALQLFGLDAANFQDKTAKFNLIVSGKGEAEEDVFKNIIKLEPEFKIVGIINDDNFSYVYLPISASQGLGIENYSRLKIKVVKDNNLNEVRNAIIEKGYMVSALSDVIDQANQIFKIIQIILGLFGVVALIVSAIGMFNTMTISLLERTQEIGIMKALGATGIDVWNMFLAESVIIGFLGGLGGIVIGVIGGELFNYGINLLAGAFGGVKIDLFYTPVWFALLIIMFSVVVGLMTGIYPASRAAKTNCLEAIRYK